MDPNSPSNSDGNQEIAQAEDLLPGYTNMSEFTKSGFSTLMESIRHANALPTQRDFNFYNAQESFKKIMSTESNQILSLINNILKHNGIKDNIKTSILDHKTELLIEANDTILEKVANNIDEMNGIKKNTINPLELQAVTGHVPINGSWNKTANTKFSVSSTIDSEHLKDNSSSNPPVRLLTAKNIIRPQKFFADKIDNSNLYPWEPKIKDKPNSMKPLAIFLEETSKGEEFSHPYEFELENFNPPTEQFIKDVENPEFPKSLSETGFIEVNKAEQLDLLVEDLRRYKIIAIDLEHHSYRTFMGITCLMQISTGKTDYIIDTLALRDKLHVLNEIFTRPSILKIFHGADSDILWLQRDLSLYVVNMFDTFQAAKILEYSSLSLASLLERFCKFKPNKHFQLADWRMRPLPDFLKEYGREDTHYLIYIYHILKNELFKKAGGNEKFLRIVYDRSTNVCKQRYFKQRWKEESHLDFYRKCKRMFDNRQLSALKDLYQWRDQIARDEDESTGYVLPNHMLLQISETLPREMQGILACCNPIPPLVRSNLLELHHIVLRARDKPLERAIMQEDTRARGSVVQLQKINMDSPLHCPHDLTKSKDFRDDLPTILGSVNNIYNNFMSSIKKCNIEKKSSVFSVFEENKIELIQNSMTKLKYLPPFERYKLVKPFVQDEERQRSTSEGKDKADVKPNIRDVKTRVLEISEAIEIEDDMDKISRNLKNLLEENKTDEERIESIRKHFLMLSKKTEEDEELARIREERLYQKAVSLVKEQNQNLVDMGGSKKRKWENSEENTNCEDRKIEHRFLNPAPYQTSDKYVPLGQKKRKLDNQEKPTTSLNQMWKKKKNRNKAKAKKDRPNFQQNQKRKLTKLEQHSPQKKVKTEQNTSSNMSGEAASTSSNFHQENQGKKRKRNDRGNFEAYDYASMDFRQFQGGAGSVTQGKNVKSNFKNKGKNKNINKAFNKSGIFKNSGRRN